VAHQITVNALPTGTVSVTFPDWFPSGAGTVVITDKEFSKLNPNWFTTSNSLGVAVLTDGGYVTEEGAHVLGIISALPSGNVGVTLPDWLPEAPSGRVYTPPSAPVVTPTGTAGTTSYFYKVVALFATGQSAASAEGSTTTGNATLSVTNYNALSGYTVSGATGYNVYRGVTAGYENTLVNATPITTSTYNDEGGGTTVSFVPSSSYSYVTVTTDEFGKLSPDLFTTANGLGKAVFVDGGVLATGAAHKVSVVNPLPAGTSEVNLPNHRVLRAGESAVISKEEYSKINPALFTSSNSFKTAILVDGGSV